MKLVDTLFCPISSRIKIKRRELGLSQEALHIKTGVHQHRISDIERQNSSPTEDEIEKISLSLGVSVKWLKTGRE